MPPPPSAKATTVLETTWYTIGGFHSEAETTFCTKLKVAQGRVTFDRSIPDYYIITSLDESTGDGKGE